MGRFGGFHLLAIVDNAAVNASVQGPASHSLGTDLEVDLLGHVAIPIFKVLKNCHNVPHSGCTIFIPSKGVGGLFYFPTHRALGVSHCPLPHCPQ